MAVWVGEVQGLGRLGLLGIRPIIDFHQFWCTCSQRYTTGPRGSPWRPLGALGTEPRHFGGRMGFCPQAWVRSWVGVAWDFDPSFPPAWGLGFRRAHETAKNNEKQQNATTEKQRRQQKHNEQQRKTTKTRQRKTTKPRERTTTKNNETHH